MIAAASGRQIKQDPFLPGQADPPLILANDLSPAESPLVFGDPRVPLPAGATILSVAKQREGPNVFVDLEIQPPPGSKETTVRFPVEGVAAPRGEKASASRYDHLTWSINLVNDPEENPRMSAAARLITEQGAERGLWDLKEAGPRSGLFFLPGDINWAEWKGEIKELEVTVRHPADVGQIRMHVLGEVARTEWYQKLRAGPTDAAKRDGVILGAAAGALTGAALGDAVARRFNPLSPKPSPVVRKIAPPVNEWRPHWDEVRLLETGETGRVTAVDMNRPDNVEVMVYSANVRSPGETVRRASRREWVSSTKLEWLGPPQSAGAEEWPMKEVSYELPPNADRATLLAVSNNFVSELNQWLLSSPLLSRESQLRLDMDRDGGVIRSILVEGSMQSISQGSVALWEAVKNAVDSFSGLANKNQESYRGTLRFRLDKKDGFWSLEISDNGAGIPGRVLGGLFLSESPGGSKDRETSLGYQGLAFSDGYYGNQFLQQRKGKVIIDTRHEQSGARELTFTPKPMQSWQFEPVTAQDVRIRPGERAERGTTVRWVFSEKYHLPDFLSDDSADAAGVEERSSGNTAPLGGVFPAEERERLRQAIADSGLTQTMVARRARLSDGQLGRFLAGTRSLQLGGLFRLMEVLYPQAQFPARRDVLAAMARQGITKKRLAELSGTDSGQLSRFVDGKRGVTSGTYYRIVKALKIPWGPTTQAGRAALLQVHPTLEQWVVRQSGTIEVLVQDQPQAVDLKRYYPDASLDLLAREAGYQQGLVFVVPPARLSSAVMPATPLTIFVQDEEGWRETIGARFAKAVDEGRIRFEENDPSKADIVIGEKDAVPLRAGQAFIGVNRQTVGRVTLGLLTELEQRGLLGPNFVVMLYSAPKDSVLIFA